jgi:hypothetical protein
MCEAPVQEQFRTQNAFDHYEIAVDELEERVAEFQVLKEKVIEFARTKDPKYDPASEADAKDKVDVGATPAVESLLDAVEELTVIGMFESHTFDATIRIAEINAGLELLSSEVQFTDAGKLIVRTTGGTEESMALALRLEHPVLDDEIVISPAQGSRHIVTFADFRDPKISAVYRIWPFPDPVDGYVYGDEYLVTEGDASFTTKQYEGPSGCADDPIHGEICDSLVQTRSTDYSCGRVVNGMAVPHGPECSRLPGENSYTVRGGCNQDRPVTLLVVMNPAEFDITCADEGVTHVVLPRGQYEVDLTCSILHQGNILYAGEKRLVLVPYEPSFLAKLVKLSVEYLASIADVNYVHNTLLSIGIPGSVITFGAIIFAVLRKQMVSTWRMRRYKAQAKKEAKWEDNWDRRNRRDPLPEYSRPRSHRAGTIYEMTPLRQAPMPPSAPVHMISYAGSDPDVSDLGKLGRKNYPFRERQ